MPHRQSHRLDLETAPEIIAMQQLRHQTKNALQRIIVQIGKTRLRASPDGCALADELERRIRLTARISDMLFGLTDSPGPLQSRVQALCDASTALLADQEQQITVDVTVHGRCPDRFHDTIVQVAHEMLGNAVKHGMHLRLVGRIVVHVQVTPGSGTTLTVSDDGWGPEPSSGGQGLLIMARLATHHGGTVSLSREGGWTVAHLYLPHSP